MPADPRHDSWKPGEPWEKALDELEYIRGLAREMGGLDRIARFHEKGKYTARERMERLADPGTFLEAGALVGAAEYAADGDLTSFKPGAYVMGLAEINGRPVAIGGDDSTISGGSPHDVHKGPWQYTQPLSLTYGIPYVALIEGVGHSSKADEHSGRMALPQGEHWWRLAELMRNVPVAAGFMGACAGLPAAAGCVSHFNCMVKDQAQVFPSGPPVVERAIGERIHKNDLGGYQMHVHTSGEVDNAAEDEEDLFDQIRSFLSYLPDNMYGVAERVETGDDPQRPVEELLHLMPTKRTRGYNPRRLIKLVVDNGEFFEMRRYFGGSLITGFGRFDGYSAGIIGNDPMVMAGAMDGPAADKYAHFVMLCDAFNLPVVIFLDMPGFMLGSAAERGAQMRRGARALLASAEAEVPKVEFAVRKSYGVAADAPHSIGHPFNVNLRFGWPAGEWGGIPIEGGVAAAYKREIEAAPDPEAHRLMIEERLLRLRSPMKAAHDFDVIDLIDPRETRRLACQFVKLAQPKLKRLADRPHKRMVWP